MGAALLTAGCEGTTKTFTPAENGLDAGREFIDACYKGDFERARFYMLPEDSNAVFLKKNETAFREKDKEQRQLLRLASINIKLVTEPNDSTVLMEYSNSADTASQKLYVLRQNNQWLVDYKKSFQ